MRQPLSDCQFHEASFSLSSVKIERIYLSHGIKMKKNTLSPAKFRDRCAVGKRSINIVVSVVN